MKTTSSAICEAADELAGFVGYHHKAQRHIVRFSEDSFGMDVKDETITPTCEFVWSPAANQLMTLSRQRLQLLALDDRMLADIGISRADAYREATRAYVDLPVTSRR